MTTHRTLTAADLPAATREAVAWLVEIEGTRLDPPMLIEGATVVPDIWNVGSVDVDIVLSVWPHNPRPHTMHGLVLKPDTPIIVTADRDDPA